MGARPRTGTTMRSARRSVCGQRRLRRNPGRQEETVSATTSVGLSSALARRWAADSGRNSIPCPSLSHRTGAALLGRPSSRAEDPVHSAASPNGLPSESRQMPSARPGGRRSLELDDALERPDEIRDTEVRQREAITRASATLVQSEPRTILAGLQALTFIRPPLVERDLEQALPEAAGTGQLSAGNSISSRGMALNDTASQEPDGCRITRRGLAARTAVVCSTPRSQPGRAPDRHRLDRDAACRALDECDGDLGRSAPCRGDPPNPPA